MALDWPVLMDGFCSLVQVLLPLIMSNKIKDVHIPHCCEIVYLSQWRTVDTYSCVNCRTHFLMLSDIPIVVAAVTAWYRTCSLEFNNCVTEFHVDVIIVRVT